MGHTVEREKQYKISEMTRLINVEAHVLRYWEEELQLPIKRNDLGHRYYTEDDKELFLRVKQLKEKGIQLKGIRSILDIPQEDGVIHSSLPQIMEKPSLSFADNKEEKSYRLQMLLKGLIQEAVEESNEKLAEDIKECLVKELDYQFRVASEEEEQHRKAYMKQQEEYFQRLDEMIQGSRHMKKKRASKWLKRAGEIV
ncbi:MAG: MerR family transcriptional regulator [Lachnospiraceae bacterium]|nr:MerR family transcriptional regulator [Lachnospiraceae bacterium]